jgi:hypothetical protein
MKTADFLGETSFKTHLERRRTPRRILTLCLYCAFLLAGTFGFHWEVTSQELEADRSNAPNPAASQAEAELLRIYDEMNQFAARLDPLTEHLGKPTCAHMISGLEGALGPSVEIERVLWKSELEVTKDMGKSVERTILTFTIEAVALDEKTATILDEVLAAYTGYEATIQSSEAVEDRWPATRLQIKLVGEPGMEASSGVDLNTEAVVEPPPVVASGASSTGMEVTS